jgi:membrane protease YdiL (CAAX protease family)
METAFFGSDGLRNGWKALLFLAGAVFCNGAAFTLRLALPGLGNGTPWLPLPWFSFLAFLFLTWLFLHEEGQPLASVGLGLDRRWFRQFLQGLLAGGGLIGLMVLAVVLAGGCHLARNPGAGAGTLLADGWLYLAVALSEELLFRGYLFQRLERGLGTRPTLALVALLFAAAHLGNPGMTGATRVWASLDIAIAGLLLGLCYLRTRSLALPMGLHLGWNWTQGALLGFGVSGLPGGGWWTPVLHRGPVWVTGGTFGLEASLPCAVVGILACGVLGVAGNADT